jgi:hypothetical protein
VGSSVNALTSCEADQFCCRGCPPRCMPRGNETKRIDAVPIACDSSGRVRCAVRGYAARERGAYTCIRTPAAALRALRRLKLQLVVTAALDEQDGSCLVSDDG